MTRLPKSGKKPKYSCNSPHSRVRGLTQKGICSVNHYLGKISFKLTPERVNNNRRFWDFKWPALQRPKDSRTLLIANEHNLKVHLLEQTKINKLGFFARFCRISLFFDDAKLIWQTKAQSLIFSYHSHTPTH